MKIKLAIIIALYALAVMVITAQQPLAEIRYICSNGNIDIYEYKTYNEEQNIAVWAHPNSAKIYYGYSPANVWVQIRFRGIEGMGHTDYAGIWVGEVLADMTAIIQVTPCPMIETVPITTPHNECLGIAPSALNMPESGVFTVDGGQYSYSGNLSFLVPVGMVWTWELWHEGQYILSFEQNEDSTCHIVGSE
jgi:hypothetical protein